jgi:hypothetical protein
VYRSETEKQVGVFGESPAAWLELITRNYHMGSRLAVAYTFHAGCSEIIGRKVGSMSQIITGYKKPDG